MCFKPLTLIKLLHHFKSNNDNDDDDNNNDDDDNDNDNDNNDNNDEDDNNGNDDDDDSDDDDDDDDDDSNSDIPSLYISTLFKAFISIILLLLTKFNDNCLIGSLITNLLRISLSLL